MKKANEEHPVYVSLRDWSKVRKADAHVVAKKTERIPSLSVPSTKQKNIK